MDKKRIKILSFAIVILLAGLLVVFMIPDDRKPASVTSDAVESDDLTVYEDVYEEKGEIYSCDMYSVSRIRVTVSGESYEFFKDGDNWHCDVIPDSLLNSAKVSQLVTRLSSLKYVDDYGATEDISGYGFNETSSKVEFTSNLGDMTLTFTESLTDTKLIYVTTSLSSSVYSINKYNTDVFLQTSSDYRNDSIRKIDLTSVSEITLANDSGITVLKYGEADYSKADFSVWEITSPFLLGGNDQTVQTSVTDAVNNMRIKDYCSDTGEFSKYGLEDKSRYLKITNDEGKSQTLYFSERANNVYYVSIDDGLNIYSVDAAMMPFADLRTIDLADRHINLAKQDSVSSVVIESGKDKINIVFSDKENKSSVNGKTMSDEDFTSNVFVRVFGLVADDICTEGRGDVVHVITVKMKDGSTDTIKFMKYNERYYSVSDNGTVKFIILQTKVNDLIASLNEYK